jgi:hypothetical protein
MIEGIESLPKIRTYPDYDRSVEQIRQYLKWLVKTENACDLVTLYVRDEMDKNEFNLIAHEGLYDVSPMYGPLVFDDFRLNLDSAEHESFATKIAPTKRGNRHGFRAREDIVSRAHFKLDDRNKDAYAALYLNWRSEQQFADLQVKGLRQHKDRIFSAVNKLKGISLTRQWNNAELQARRWIDQTILRKDYQSLDDLIVEGIYRFFEDFDKKEMFRIVIARLQNGRLRYERKNYMDPYGRQLKSTLSKEDKGLYRWVVKTTRPRFLSFTLEKDGQAHKIYKIVVPIRLPAHLSTCIGAVSIECVHKPLTPEMVKPLCYLVDHFGRIEEERRRKN